MLLNELSRFLMCLGSLVCDSVDKISKPFTRPKAIQFPLDKWFTQTLDHYDSTNRNTWKQRYHVIDDFYQPGGPAFLLLNGESDADPLEFKRSSVVTYAEKVNGIVFELEHRFYGKSKPTSDVSTSNLKYLTIELALADAAFFIVGMNAEYKLPSDIKWIAIGCSYAGNLAAWMRYKFPNLVYASVATSGPLLAKYNFPEFLQVAKESISSVNGECVTLIRQAYNLFKKSSQESTDLDDLSKKFKLCDTLDNTNPKNAQCTLQNLSYAVGILVQLNHVFNTTIKVACDTMTNTLKGSLLDRYAEITNSMLVHDRRDCWHSIYSKSVEDMKGLNWDDKYVKNSERQWFYQVCTEFGFFATSYKKIHFFYDDVPLDYFTQLCTDVFGEQIIKTLTQQGVTRTNVFYGGLDNKATRVLYVFGSHDPWYPLGITSTRISESPVIGVIGESHCPCTKRIKKTDSLIVKEAFDNVERKVIEWSSE